MSNKLGMIPGLTVVYPVSDRKKTTAWYQEHFGFELMWDSDEIGFCELKSVIETVFIGLSDRQNPEVKGGATLTWGTEDIEAVRSRMESAGIKFDGPTREHPGIVKLATLYDPDGNHIMLYQSLS
ncbi:MAG: VOC family protein [Fimbriimonadaceae bacterium]